MFSASSSAKRYQPRPQDAGAETFQGRLSVCESCASREGQQCKSERNHLVTVMARKSAAHCPEHRWPGDQPPVAPEPIVLRAEEGIFRRAFLRAVALVKRMCAPKVAPPAVTPPAPLPIQLATEPLDPRRYPAIDPQNVVRHLVCHFYPRTAGQKWRRTVAHLAARKALFNGRRIVCIATDHECDPASDVRDAFAAAEFQAEFIDVQNDAKSGESATFAKMLERFARPAAGEITFYCHSKGSTWAQSRSICHEWADVMFAANLDYPELVNASLSTAAFCGAFRNRRLLHDAPWHYSGTFFWFRNDALFRDERWRKVTPAYGGIEAWPGQQWPAIAQTACLFLDSAENLYDADYWETTVRPAWRAFRKAQRKDPGDGAP